MTGVSAAKPEWTGESAGFNGFELEIWATRLSHVEHLPNYGWRNMYSLSPENVGIWPYGRSSNYMGDPQFFVFSTFDFAAMFGRILMFLISVLMVSIIIVQVKPNDFARCLRAGRFASSRGGKKLGRWRRGPVGQVMVGDGSSIPMCETPLTNGLSYKKWWCVLAMLKTLNLRKNQINSSFLEVSNSPSFEVNKLKMSPQILLNHSFDFVKSFETLGFHVLFSPVSPYACPVLPMPGGLSRRSWLRIVGIWAQPWVFLEDVPCKNDAMIFNKFIFWSLKLSSWKLNTQIGSKHIENRAGLRNFFRRSEATTRRLPLHRGPVYSFVWVAE